MNSRDFPWSALYKRCIFFCAVIIEYVNLIVKNFMFHMVKRHIPPSLPPSDVQCYDENYESVVRIEEYYFSLLPCAWDPGGTENYRKNLITKSTASDIWPNLYVKNKNKFS
jgi:hypothetical protein